MMTFVMLTRLVPGAMRSPRELESLERSVMEKIQNCCPGIEWMHSYAVLGSCDYVDIFRVRDVEAATRVAALVRTFGHAQTELWPAMPWRDFKSVIRDLADAEENLTETG